MPSTPFTLAKRKKKKKGKKRSHQSPPNNNNSNSKSHLSKPPNKKPKRKGQSKLTKHAAWNKYKNENAHKVKYFKFNGNQQNVQCRMAGCKFTCWNGTGNRAN